MSGYGGTYGGTYGGLAPESEVHIDAALERVLEQYKEQPNIEKLLRMHVARWQSLENLLQAILSFGLLANATGWLLSVYGGILDLPRRPGWSDDQWRYFLRLKVQVLKSSGTGPELIAIAQAMRSPGSTDRVRLFPELPGAVRIEIPDVPVDVRELAVELLGLAVAAPERVVVVFYEPGAGFAFRSPGTTYGFSNGRFGRGISNEEH